MASGLRAATRGHVAQLPFEVRARSFAEVGLVFQDVPSLASAEVYLPRDWFEGPEWISEICNSMPFKEVFRYRFKKSGHINVNEASVYKSWLKAMAKSQPCSRFVGLLDSRVTIGATAKGRSSSPAISRILQGCLAYALGAELYPACLHCRSDDNRSDAPSRDCSVEEPSRDQPTRLCRQV